MKTKLINQATIFGLGISSSDIKGVDIKMGSVIVDFYFPKTTSMENKLKEFQKKFKLSPQTLDLNVNTLQGVKKLSARTMDITTATSMKAAGYYGESQSSVTAPDGTPRASNTFESSAFLPSQMGVQKSFCHLNCGLQIKDSEKDAQGNLIPPYYVWRTDCEKTPPCKENNCANCEDSPNYIAPTNRPELIKQGYIDPSKEPLPVRFTNQGGYSQRQTPVTDPHKCHKITDESQCNTNRNCFFCISDKAPTERNCVAIDAQGKYVCDFQYASACVPLVENADKTLGVYTEGPLQNPGNFTFSQSTYPGLKKASATDTQKMVLDYPLEGKCMPPIKRTLSADNSRDLAYRRYRPGFASR